MKRIAVRIIIYFFAGLAEFFLFFILHSALSLSDEMAAVFGALLVATFSVFLLIEYLIFLRPLFRFIRAQRSMNGKKAIIEKMPYDLCLTELTKKCNEVTLQLNNLEETRKSFLSNVSHELRSPITSIQGFLQAIIDGTIDAEDHTHYIKIVYDETKRLGDIINSMLNLSRLEAGNSPITNTIFDINELARGVCVKFQRKIYNKSMTLETDFKMDPCYVYADKEKIEQVLINLIENAINYSPENTKITVISAAHIKKAYITVEDQGYGIEPEDQQHIFDRFYTVDKARTPSKNKGTGLGLAIIKKIIQDQGEIVWVESEKDKGSRFTFTLMLFDPAAHLNAAQKNGFTL